MQWLIDIIKAWADARFLQPPCFVWRGNRILPYFDFTNLTQDGNWYELDLSGIVPSGATAVSLHVKGQAASIGMYMRLRPAGSSNSAYTCRLRPQVANVAIAFNPTVALSTDRKIEYQIVGGIMVPLHITVLGWWH